jgi:hypothetical protein
LNCLAYILSAPDVKQGVCGNLIQQNPNFASHGFFFISIGLLTVNLCCNFRYGEKAAAATNQGMDAAGHAIGTAWAVFKIRRALNPKSVLKPTTLAKSTIKANVADLRAKHTK